MITIKDIARLSGCSISTVSRALNDHSDVSEESRKRILKIVEEQGFTPNSNAKKLKQKPEGIVVLVKGANNILFADILEKIRRSMHLDKKKVSVFYIQEDENEVLYAKNKLNETKPRGILFLGGNLEYFRDEFAGIDIPSVLLTNDARQLDEPRLSSFTTDDSAAFEYLADYIISKGHRHIGVVGGNANKSSTQVSYRRIAGCKKSFEKHGIKLTDDQYAPCHFSMNEAYEATMELLKKNPDMTAVMALSDVIAMGAIRAIWDSGKRVPEDISITGFDGVEFSKFTVPRLTTIRQDTDELANAAIEDLLDRINYSSDSVCKMVPFQFIEGESVKNIKERENDDA